MKIVVVTGGIGSGKSEVCRILSDMGLDLQYHADDRVKRLYAEHPSLLDDIESQTGCLLRDDAGVFAHRHDPFIYGIEHRGLALLLIGAIVGENATHAVKLLPGRKHLGILQTKIFKGVLVGDHINGILQDSLDGKAGELVFIFGQQSAL